jgi:hypothetical protein
MPDPARQTGIEDHFADVEDVSLHYLAAGRGESHSAVRHGLGASFSGETLNGDWMLADVHMKGYPCPDTEASVYWHRDGRLRHLPDLSRPLSCSCGFACYKWRLIDDAPWRRCYVVLKPGAADLFAGRE